mgnify:CR=1 FL=1
MDINKCCPEKVVSAEMAIAKIKRGSRVFVGTGCGEPQHLIHAMAVDKGIRDIMIYQMLSHTLVPYLDDPSFGSRFLLKLFFISESMRKAAYEGKIDYLPTYLSQIPKLFENYHISLDVALIQVSPPDRFGLASLGVSVDITMAAAQSADLVIAQINSNMPRVLGRSFIHVNEVDCFVEHDEPLLTIGENPELAAANDIGRLIAQRLVDDGATIAIGMGTTEQGNIKTHIPKLKMHTLR